MAGFNISDNLIVKNGSIGIGISDPNADLHVVGNAFFSSSVEEVVRVNTTGNSAAIHWRESDAIRGLMGFSNGSSIYTGADADDMVIRSEAKLHIVSNTSSHGITINSGNVGIGTTSPVYKLHVPDTIGSRILELGHGVSYARITTDDATKPLDLQINDSNKMRIATNGNVGIGTDSPSEKLHVSGNIKTTGVITSEGSSGSSFYALQLSRSGSGTTTPDIWGTNNTLVIGTSSSVESVSFSGANSTFYGDATVNGNLYLSDQMRIGDDAWIEDFNVANSIRIKGNQDSTQGYIAFGNRTEKLGQNNSGTLTFNGNTVWHAGNDGSGTGLDADTVDGSHASSFHTSGYPAFSQDSINKSSIAARTDSGFYEHDSTNTTDGWTGATTSWQHMIACTHTNNSNYYSMQIAGSFFDQNFYGRKTDNSGTRSWSKFWSDYNDGSGSGLDADTLDGQHASAFASSTPAATLNIYNSSGTVVKTIRGI